MNSMIGCNREWYFFRIHEMAKHLYWVREIWFDHKCHTRCVKNICGNMHEMSDKFVWCIVWFHVCGWNVLYEYIRPSYSFISYHFVGISFCFYFLISDASALYRTVHSAHSLHIPLSFRCFVVACGTGIHTCTSLRTIICIRLTLYVSCCVPIFCTRCNCAIIMCIA